MNRLSRNILLLLVCLIVAHPVWSNTDDLGGLRQAISLGRYQQVVALGSKLLEADLVQSERVEVLVAMASAKQALGYFQDAEVNLKQAKETAQSDPALEALVLAAHGDFLLASHRIEESRVMLARGLTKAKSTGDSILIARILNNLGNLFATSTVYKQALFYYSEAMELPGISEDKGLWSILAVNRARVAWRAGQPDLQNHLDAAERSLISLPPGHDRIMGLLTISQIQFLSQKSGQKLSSDLKKSLIWLTEAVRLAEIQDDARALSQAAGQQGEIYEWGRRFPEATRLTRQALFHAQRVNAADLIYLWQSQLGRLARAEGRRDEAMQHFRAAMTTLNDLRKEMYRGARDDAEQFQDHVAPVYYQLVDLLLQQAATLPEGEAHTALLREVRQIMEQLKTSELQNLFQDECVTALKHQGADMDHLEKGTAIYYPILLPDRLEILLTISGKVRQITVPVKSVQVTDTVREFREQLENLEGDDYLQLAQRLHRWLIAPVATVLNAEHVKTLVIVPDGMLRIMPFSALHDGKQFLAESIAVAITPSLRLTDARALPRQKDQMFISALSKGGEGFSALPNVVKEVKNIQQIYKENFILMDQDFTVANAEKTMEDKPFSVVHIASHGQFDRDPHNTFLLTYDGRMNMNNLEAMISRGRMRDQPVELLTLSACQTAVGDDRAALGLAGVAVKAGARSALASLWSIDDEAAALLVSDFYGQMQKANISKAEALRKAQVSLIAGKRLNHPGFWSAFIMIGNWL
ncbi:MAG: CHAT domain-containing protein [Magnetococcales bacterium]|nr:CHAT domain-containing protein [Magnetococcales bacterium]